jgi:hypothetical protein
MSTVYLVQQPRPSRDRGWTPDLSTAQAFGKIVPVFSAEDRPDFLPNESLFKARSVLRNFGPDDYLLFVNGSPVAFALCVATIVQNNPHGLQLLRWERKPVEGSGMRDPRQGYYIPVEIKLHNRPNVDEGLDNLIGAV